MDSSTNKRPLASDLYSTSSTPSINNNNDNKVEEEPNSKRLKTSEPSDIPGIADIPIDVEARQSFYNTTRGFLAAGAIPLDLNERSTKGSQDVEMQANGDGKSLREAGDLMNGGSLNAQNGSSSSSNSTPNNGAKNSRSNQERNTHIDGKLIVDYSTLTEAEKLDQFAHKYLLIYWKDNVSVHASPKYELFYGADMTKDDSVNPTLGCHLTLEIPGSTTPLIFNVPAEYSTRKDAKEAVTKLAINKQALVLGKSGRESVGAELEPEKDEFDELKAPFAELSQIHQKFMPIGPLKVEYTNDTLNLVHGATLTIPITTTVSKTFSTGNISESNKKARDEAARLAFRDGVPALLEDSFKERLVVDTGGYITFKAGETVDATTIDPSIVLGQEVSKLIGYNKCLSYTPTQVVNKAGVHLFGSELAIHIHPHFSRHYVASNTFRNKKDAKTGVASIALKGGLIDELQEAIASDPAFGKGKKPIAEKNQPRLIAGSIPEADIRKLENAVAYIHVCFQQWAGPNPPALDFVFDFDTESKLHSCKLTIVLSPTDTRVYEVREQISRKAAKEGVVQVAFQEKILDAIKPKSNTTASSTSSTVARTNSIRGGGNSSRGGRGDSFASRGNGRDSIRGSERGRGRGGNNQHVQYPNHQQYSNQQYNNQYPQQSHQQQPQHNSGYGYNSAPPPPAATSNSSQGQIVKYLDDFCLSWFGPRYQPIYDVRQNQQTGLYGAILRIPTTQAEKQFWTDQDHYTRGDAQIAVAKIAVHEGVIEAIKREFQPFNFHAQQQQQQQQSQYQQYPATNPAQSQYQANTTPYSQYSSQQPQPQYPSQSQSQSQYSSQNQRYPSQSYPPQTSQQNSTQYNQPSQYQQQQLSASRGDPSTRFASVRTKQASPPVNVNYQAQKQQLQSQRNEHQAPKYSPPAPSSSKQALPSQSRTQTPTQPKSSIPTQPKAQVPTVSASKPKVDPKMISTSSAPSGVAATKGAPTVVNKSKEVKANGNGNGNEKKVIKPGEHNSGESIATLKAAFTLLLESGKQANYNTFEDTSSHYFGAELRVPVGSSVTTFKTAPIHSSKASAKEAVAKLAIAQNVLVLLKEAAFKEWTIQNTPLPAVSAEKSKEVLATVASIISPVVVKAPAVVAPSVPIPSIPISVPVVTPSIPSLAVTKSLPEVVAVVNRASAPITTVPTQVLNSEPQSISKTTSLPAVVTQSTTVAKNSRRGSSITALEEFCRTNSREAPTFFEEPTEKRCWLVIGEQRFEQPPSTNPNSTPSLKEMKEKLSSRVLKHFVKELAASKQ